MDFGTVDTETLLSGTGDWIDPELAARLAEQPLDAVEREYPHFVRTVESPDGVERPSERHPLFYGCYDWHSAVHSHWALVRQLRLFEDHPAEPDIVQSIDSRLTAENVERERERFEENESFEKPYGWAWFLHLAAELSRWESEHAAEWRSALEPLEEKIVALVKSEFLTQGRPFRVGTHRNSAFALHCIHDYARTTSHDRLASAAAETAIDFFGEDRDYPVEYEPLEHDFLSPALAEADLMRRVYDQREFRAWAEQFFPDVTTEPYDAILDPTDVASDPDESVALHLVGLNLSKAWSLAGIADDLGDHEFTDVFEESAGRHAERGLAQAFTDSYAGSHWLHSFALYLLTRNEGGIASA